MYDLHFRDITVRGFWLNTVRDLGNSKDNYIVFTPFVSYIVVASIPKQVHV